MAARGQRAALEAAAKQLLKRTIPTMFFRHPTTTLEPERLYAFLDAVWAQRDAEGAVVEVGCYLGGTAALAFRFGMGVARRDALSPTLDDSLRARVTHRPSRHASY
jgi:hypothetical protein